MQCKVIMGPLLLFEKFVQVSAYLYVNFRDFICFFISYIIVIINLFMAKKEKSKCRVSESKRDILTSVRLSMSSGKEVLYVVIS